MELMDILAVSLGSQIRPGGTGLGKRMCEVTVRNYEGCQMGGDVSHPAVADRRTFINEFDLKEEIAAMLDPLPEGSGRMASLSPEAFMWQLEITALQRLWFVFCSGAMLPGRELSAGGKSVHR